MSASFASLSASYGSASYGSASYGSASYGSASYGSASYGSGSFAATAVAPVYATVATNHIESRVHNVRTVEPVARNVVTNVPVTRAVRTAVPVQRAVHGVQNVVDNITVNKQHVETYTELVPVTRQRVSLIYCKS